MRQTWPKSIQANSTLTWKPRQQEPAWRQLLACYTHVAHVAAQDLGSWGIADASAGVFAGV